jgi:hypothetical protein
MGRGSGQSLFSAFPQVGGLLRYDVAQREPLRVTEPAHLFRRGGSLLFTNHWHPQSMHAAQLTALQLMKYHQYHQS